MGKVVGSGAFGVAYFATWRNESVVVKQMHSYLREKEEYIAVFIKEANAMKKLRPHPCIVSFLGVCTNPEHSCIVIEWMAGGSLENMLRDHSKIIPLKLAKKFIKSIAAGMGHIHSEDFLHCDLAARNCLIHNDTLKIADFGMSKVCSKGVYNFSSETQFPVRWASPEILSRNSRGVSRASDVWSFGVTCWEILQRSQPYLGKSNQEVMDGVCSGLRLQQPKDCPQKLWTIIESCWNKDPTLRPDFITICHLLINIEREEGSFSVNDDYQRLFQLPEPQT